MDQETRKQLQKTKKDPTEENVDKLAKLYVRQGTKMCSCENGRCSHWDNPTPYCLEPSNMNTWIQMLGPFCDTCVKQMPLEYHGDFENYYEFPNRVRNCECYWCSSLDDWLKKGSKFIFVDKSRFPTWLQIITGTEHRDPFIQSTAWPKFSEYCKFFGIK